MDKYLQELIQGDVIYKSKHYSVLAVKMPDMPTSTYAIINDNTGMMEQLHPTLFGSKRLADMFSEAEDGKEASVDDADLLSGVHVEH